MSFKAMSRPAEHAENCYTKHYHRVEAIPTINTEYQELDNSVILRKLRHDNKISLNENFGCHANYFGLCTLEL